MATVASVFVPNAVQRMKQIKAQAEQLQAQATALYGDWARHGKTAMGGLADVDWTAYPFTQAEFMAGCEDLATAHNAIALQTIVAGYGTALKIAVGN